jgi:hypothetical protein
LRTDNFCDVSVYRKFLSSNLFCANEIDEEWLQFSTEKRENNCYTDQNATLVIVSDTTLKYDRLYSMIQTTNFEINDKVLVCLPNNLRNIDDIKSRIENIGDLPIVFEHDCDRNVKINDLTLAVLAPAALDLDEKIPMILYNTPKVNENTFPKSINLLRNLRPLKFAYMNFLNHMKWQRVAILSDDSDSSEQFLDEILPLFNDKKILYTDQRCSSRTCEFIDVSNNNNFPHSHQLSSPNLGP